MAIAASSLLTLSLWLAVIIGPQMRMWSWGPALLALSAALACAAIAAAREKRPILGPVTLILGLAVTGWFTWRAWTSPIAELAHADLMLLGATVGCFIVCRAIAHNARAEAVFLWGLAALLAASIAMMVGQLGNPDFSQFRSRPAAAPTGFYAHYNEGANFLIGAAFLLLGSAAFGKRPILVRLLWLGVAILGLAAIWFTRSRGAVFGAVIGFVVLSTFILVIGSKRKASWFAPAVIAFPILVLASGFLLYFGWEKVQRARSDGKQGIVEMMDNTSRLRNYSLSFDAIKLNPITGGGSRSYSWSSLQSWDPKEHGQASNLPEQTHNEILQAATDYGLIGAGGILALIGWLSLRALWHSKFDEEKCQEPSHSMDALRLGGIAALAGMLVQSSFSFVFHLLPGAMLLGIALGRIAAPGAQSSGVARIGRISAACLAIFVGILLIPTGIAGTRVLNALAPIYYKIQNPTNESERIARFSQAIAISTHSEFHLSRALIHHNRAVKGSEVVDPVSLELALQDYLDAAQANAKFPAHFVNAANLQSLSGNANAAEELYEIAINLQGNMEPAFRAHYHRAEHFRRLGLYHLQNQNPTAAIASMEIAFRCVQDAEAKSAWLLGDLRNLRNAVLLGLAYAHEAAGDYKTALHTMNSALGIRGNHSFRYHIGMLEFRRAMTLWRQRQPDAALPSFKSARGHLLGARNHPPQGLSRSSIQQQIEEIDEILKLLREAGIRNH